LSLCLIKQAPCHEDVSVTDGSRHYMKVCDQLHPVEGVPVTIEQEAGCAPEPVWALWNTKKYLAPAGNRTPAVHPVAIPAEPILGFAGSSHCLTGMKNWRDDNASISASCTKSEHTKGGRTPTASDKHQDMRQKTQSYFIHDSDLSPHTEVARVCVLSHHLYLMT
jgi:hypothetical protein